MRRLDAADAAPYRALMLDAYARFAEAFTSTAGERAAKPVEWWAERIAAADGASVAFGAFDGDRLVGSAGLEFETREKTKHKSLLFGMIVLPDYRGRGLGRALIEAAIEHARAQPATTLMQLFLTGGNEPAQKLYESCGFEVYGVEPNALLMDGAYRSRVLMWQPLRGGGADGGPAGARAERRRSR